MDLGDLMSRILINGTAQEDSPLTTEQAGLIGQVLVSGLHRMDPDLTGLQRALDSAAQPGGGRTSNPAEARKKSTHSAREIDRRLAARQSKLAAMRQQAMRAIKQEEKKLAEIEADMRALHCQRTQHNLVVLLRAVEKRASAISRTAMSGADRECEPSVKTSGALIEQILMSVPASKTAAQAAKQYRAAEEFVRECAANTALGHKAREGILMGLRAAKRPEIFEALMRAQENFSNSQGEQGSAASN